jgi:hypothetical protein
VKRIVPLLVALVAIAQAMDATPAQEACPTAGRVSVATEPLSAEQQSREKLLVPGTVARPGLASPTRAPWVNTNGARFMRTRDAKFRYELPEGKGALAAAEAVAYDADAVLQVVPGDLPSACRVFAFIKDVPAASLPGLADIGVIDDGSPLLGEVLNLFVRRNLLFQLVGSPQKTFAVNVKLGTAEYPAAEAADPSAFALKVRRTLGDDRRTLRIFGSEVVIGRLTGEAGRARLYLINYGNREITGLRVRVRGEYRGGEAYVLGQGRVALVDQVVDGGATEFSVPLPASLTIVDLRK